jgi:hypothetical protein
MPNFEVHIIFRKISKADIIEVIAIQSTGNTTNVLGVAGYH